MKKLLIIFLLLGLSIYSYSQSIWQPIDKNMFQSEKKYTTSLSVISSVWLWRFSANITAEELTYNTITKKFASAPLSSIGPAIGYKHYTELPDGTAYNDVGFSAILLFGTDINQINPAVVKVGLVVNAFQYINVGIDTNFKTFGILLGASINF